MCKTEIRGFRIEMYKDIDMDKKMGEQSGTLFFSMYPLQAAKESEGTYGTGGWQRSLLKSSTLPL